MRFGFGAGVDPRLQVPFEERFGFPLIEAWAMTETGGGAVILPIGEPRMSARAASDAPEVDWTYRIVDDNGADVAPGIAGRIAGAAEGRDRGMASSRST